jgi:hypothetical protein
LWQSYPCERSPRQPSARVAAPSCAAQHPSLVGRSALRAGARRSRVGDRSGAQSRPGAFGTWRAVGALRCQRTALSIPRDTFPHDRAERIAAAAQHQMLQRCGSTRRSATRLRLRFIMLSRFPSAMPMRRTARCPVRVSASCAMRLCGCRCTLTKLRGGRTAGGLFVVAHVRRRDVHERRVVAHR